MKTLRFRLLACALASMGAAADAQPLPVHSVANVDLGRYLGKWYEIAAFPMFFQRQGVGDSEISVVNRCRTEKGFDEAVGRAWAVEGTGNGQLEVSFFWPFRSDYWIIGLDDDYRWAVVGNPNRKYLWVLSRTPQLAGEALDRALQAAASQGFDLAPLKYTAHGHAPGAAGPEPGCLRFAGRDASPTHRMNRP
jgi:apolipoprotein D and lipocalin family protein